MSEKKAKLDQSIEGQLKFQPRMKILVIMDI